MSLSLEFDVTVMILILMDDGDIGGGDDPEENPEVGNIQLEEECQGFKVEMSLTRMGQYELTRI